MVLKKDPRAVLDMLSKPVDMDEDEFLDKLDKDKSFSLMPSKPTQDLNDNPLTSQQHMLDSIADQEVEEEDVILTIPDALTAEPSKGEQRFLAMYKNSTPKEDGGQSEMPSDVQLKKVNVSGNDIGMPTVAGETEEEKAAKEEDLARRAAYVEIYAKKEAEKVKDAEYEKTHKKFLGIFGNVKEQRWEAK